MTGDLMGDEQPPQASLGVPCLAWRRGEMSASVRAVPKPAGSPSSRSRGARISNYSRTLNGLSAEPRIMSHDNSPKKLIYMANQIGKFFAPQGHETAVAGIANLLAKFWNPSMRKKIVRHLSEGGEGLDPLVMEAVQTLRAKQSDEAGYFG
jgi:formate dehydrogenase subunit delta